MDNKSYVKSLLALKRMTITELAAEMTKATGKKYTRDSINGKFARDTISHTEMKQILEILGYHIEVVKD